MLVRGMSVLREKKSPKEDFSLGPPAPFFPHTAVFHARSLILNNSISDTASAWNRDVLKCLLIVDEVCDLRLTALEKTG